MGERKVLNKYYPPDFDPRLLPRGNKPKNDQYKVRTMIPFSIRCFTCGEYMGRGRKFNARKETVEGAEYLGIRIYRFYLKCTRCASELTLRTDPKNSDYIVEAGGQRLVEEWRKKEKALEEHRDDKKQVEEGDAMTKLETKTLDSKQEMDILDALDEIRTENARNENVDIEAVIQENLMKQAQEADRLTEEESAKFSNFLQAQAKKKRVSDNDNWEAELLKPRKKQRLSEDGFKKPGPRMPKDKKAAAAEIVSIMEDPKKESSYPKKHSFIIRKKPERKSKKPKFIIKKKSAVVKKKEEEEEETGGLGLGSLVSY